MAFQAMNHGLEARATSPPRTEATHNLKADRALVAPHDWLRLEFTRNAAAIASMRGWTSKTTPVPERLYTQLLRPLKGSVLGVSDSGGIAHVLSHAASTPGYRLSSLRDGFDSG